MSTVIASGVYVPAPTFFVRKSDEEYDEFAPALDLDTQLRHTIFLAKAGIRGVVLLGSTGEAVHVTREERKQLLRHIRKGLDAAGFTDFAVIAGTATNSTVETVELIKECAESGASTALVLAPSYFAGCVSQEGLIKWYTLVADRSPIPIMIYYYPGVSNNIAISPQTFLTLAEHPNIVGTKLSHGNISHHAIIAGSPVVKQQKQFKVFTGLGQQLFPALAVGCAGAIDGLAAIFPRSVVKLYELATSDHYAEAADLQYAISCAEEMIVEQGTVGIKEAVSRVLGFGDPDGCRPPLSSKVLQGAAWNERYGDAFAAMADLERSW
ncbi:hypothetical protein BZA70DRAFT_105796 [Myxozyma melibiosi]|uniref:Dihydrodipicolinate synthetase n=1 Tax=Myxozyma melibiosi TaxID=54550 RepID=A0ABR1F9H6_9ASCO